MSFKVKGKLKERIKGGAGREGVGRKYLKKDGRKEEERRKENSGEKT